MASGGPERSPMLYLVAGPNGSGKSTLTRNTYSALLVPVIDPDQEARILSPTAPETVPVEAGRRALERIQEYLDSARSFATETTLSGSTYARLMEKAKSKGYDINLVYIGVETVDICIERIASRVAKGGHTIPLEDIRRPYQRSLANLPKAISLADHVVLYDNSNEEGPHKIIAIERGLVVAEEQPLPQWVIDSVGAVLKRPDGDK